MAHNTWFTASKDGLRKLVEHLPRKFVIFELVQNVWDEEATVCEISMERIAGTPFVRLICRDDNPEGFANLEHAYTIWAESSKKKDPTQAGRFNEGEKKVLALCRSAEISSTKGTILFKEDGKRTTSSRKTDAGSVFTGELRMTKEQEREVIEAFGALLPRSDCETTLNGVRLSAPETVCDFEVALPTLYADEEGNLRPTKRKTTVQVFEPRDGEVAMLYELGIPVVETGDRYHVNVMQKVPLNRDRDNVTPKYLRTLRGAVLIATVDALDEDGVDGKWVDDALADEAVEGDTVRKTMEARHGKKRAMYDGSDLEANSHLTGEGYEVIPRGAYSSEVRNKILETGGASKSGDLRPTPKPFSNDPNAPIMEEIPFEEWTEGMREVADIARHLSEALGVRDDLLVVYGKPKARWWGGAWGDALYWNVTSLGAKWFDHWHQHPEAFLSLLIHEFAHKGAPNHLEDRYHKNCTRLAAAVAMYMCRSAHAIPHWGRVMEGQDSAA